MTIFAEIILVASAVILAYFLFSIRRHNMPEIFLHNLVYNPNKNILKLTLENYGTKPLHVKPAFRLVHLKSAEEWKTHVTEDGVPMMAGREMSLIKGYELLAQANDCIQIPAQDLHDIEFELEEDSNLQAYDNVRISMLCGANPIKLTDAVHSTIRVKVDEVIEPAMGEEIVGAINLDEILESSKNQGFIPTQGTFEVVEADFTPTEIELEVPLIEEKDPSKKPSIRKRVVRNGFPLEATCVCCGQLKWLKWVVDDRHVCVECRDFLYDKLKDEYTPKELELNLTDRQEKILDHIGAEGETTLKQISDHLGKSRSTTNKEIKALIELGAVEKQKEKNRNLYTLA